MLDLAGTGSAIEADFMAFGVDGLAVRATRSVAFGAAKLDFVDVEAAAMRAFFIAAAEPPCGDDR